ncbi:quattro [Aplochiton taeniatus]
MNPESLDSSIQSALSALFPPFEATAPTVLSQLFRTIEERYHGDALHCLLDFLIPAKHLLESVQQAACAAYSDVLFRCEGWPLCLRDKTVIQLAPLNPLLLRPGDFYLQVQPFGEQAARVVLKSLLEEGCRQMEETPIPETSYPSIFTQDWLREVNDGRQGTPLTRCLVSTDQGVMKLPWAKIAVPEFLDKPKTTQAAPSVVREAVALVPRQQSVSSSRSATLPMETMVLPARDGISVSLRLLDGTSKLIEGDHVKPTPKPRSKPLVKPIGWVSPNTWDSQNSREMEGDYVDLIDFAKEKAVLSRLPRSPKDSSSPSFKPVRPAPPVPAANGAPCGRTLRHSEEPCTPCSQRKLVHIASGQELKCRYRESYLAALCNPVPFEKGGADLLTALEEAGPGEGEGFKGPSGGPGPDASWHQGEGPAMGHKAHLQTPCGDVAPVDLGLPHMEAKPGNLTKETLLVHKVGRGEHDSRRAQSETGQNSKGSGSPQLVSEACHDSSKPPRLAEGMEPAAKNKVKIRSLSTVSETAKVSPLLHKPNPRSLSDICPEMIPGIHVVQCKQAVAPGWGSPKGKKRQPPKKDSLADRGETPLLGDRQLAKLQHSRSDKASAPPIPPAASDGRPPLSPPAPDSCYRSISALLQLGLICLPGSRDKAGRAVVEVHGERLGWASPLVSAPDICKLLVYIHSIPRKEVRDLGLTLVMDARKKPPPPLLYKALLMVQEQALHALHCILMLVDKDANLRHEKQPGLQIDMVTSLKALNKTVDAQQLTFDLGGTYPYSHTDWFQFHQKLVSFLADLQGAHDLLQRAIEKIDVNKQMDIVQEVQQCIQEQRTSMKEVLMDARLVLLQREGGAILARMRREEFRFSRSEDYRDAMDTVTALYNQVEEKVHTLVMRSNTSLQYLDFLSRLREMEGQINKARTWFHTEGEQCLKKPSPLTESTLENVERNLKDFDSFLSQAKERKQQASTLVIEAENLLGTSDSRPETEVFRTVVNTFKSNMTDFLVHAEQRHKDLDNTVYLFRFCQQASALAKECEQYLEQLETGCHPAMANLSLLKTYANRLDREFAAQHFQAVKARARVGSSESPFGGLAVWNAAWDQCQDIRQLLKERMKTATDKNQSSIGGAQGEKGLLEPGKESSGEGEAGSSQNPAPVISPELGHHSENSAVEDSCAKTSADLKSSSSHFQADLKGRKEAILVHFPESTDKEAKLSRAVPQSCSSHPETKWRPREHHSEADLRSVTPVGGEEAFPWHQALGRSLSEGSCVTLCLSSSSGSCPLSVRHTRWELKARPLELGPTQQLPFPPIESSCFGHSCGGSKKPGDVEGGVTERSSIPPQCFHGDGTKAEPLLSATQLVEDGGNGLKLQRIMEELLMTEREYVRALGYVREHYFPELGRTDVPQDLRGQRGNIFGNLEKLHDFHRHHFLKELEGCLKEPFRVGRCFLRHRGSFSLYALYSKNKPQSDNLLINHGQDFFKNKQLQLGDKMDLASYLLKPVQRISKYSLLLQDMIRECGSQRAREMAEVQAALEVVQFQLRHGNNLLAMDDIYDCDVNLKEQGQLIRQDEFLVSFRKKKCYRHIFLFQDLILFSKTKKTDVGNDTYIYKQSFKTSDIGMTHNSGDSGLCFEIWFRRRKSHDTYTLQAASRQVKEAWTKDLERILWEQAVHNREIRMQERVFMGLGSKPFIDIQPSDAAINDRAVNYVLMGRECKAVSSPGSSGLQGGFPLARPNSVGEGSGSSSSGSNSSSSSGRGSLSPVGYLCGPTRRGSKGHGGYAAPPGVMEEDDLDHESGSHHLLMDSSESSGESVSGFSSSYKSCHSVMGGEAEEPSSLGSSTVILKDAQAHQSEASPHLNKTSSSA